MPISGINLAIVDPGAWSQVGVLPNIIAFVVAGSARFTWGGAGEGVIINAFDGVAAGVVGPVAHAVTSSDGSKHIRLNGVQLQLDVSPKSRMRLERTPFAAINGVVIERSVLFDSFTRLVRGVTGGLIAVIFGGITRG